MEMNGLSGFQGRIETSRCRWINNGVNRSIQAIKWVRQGLCLIHSCCHPSQCPGLWNSGTHRQILQTMWLCWVLSIPLHFLALLGFLGDCSCAVVMRLGILYIFFLSSVLLLNTGLVLASRCVWALLSLSHVLVWVSLVGIWERWGGPRASVGSGPVSPSPFRCHPALPGWEQLSPGQSDLIWHPLCFLQEKGSQPALWNQGIVSFLCRNRTFGGKESFKNKMLFKNALPLSKPSHLKADSWADTSATNNFFCFCPSDRFPSSNHF